MSLTSHLKSKDSLVRSYLVAQLPNTRAAIASKKTQLQNVDTIRPNAPLSYSLVGTALDYRLRYYFDATPFAKLVAAHGAMYACGRTAASFEELLMPDEVSDTKLTQALVDGFEANLQHTLDRIQPVNKRLVDGDEALLCQYCLVLAHFEQIFRSGEQGSELLLPTPKRTIQELMGVAKDAEVLDLCTLSWGFYDKFSHLYGKPTVLNPAFSGSRDVGGADADLIIDGCLVDIKATINPRLDPSWLYQLIGYVLLDYPDQYRIKSVAIYLARQRILLEWTVDDLLTLIGGAAVPSLNQLREGFKKVAKSQGR